MSAGPASVSQSGWTAAAILALSLVLLAALALLQSVPVVRAIDERLMLFLREPTDVSDPLGPRWVEDAVRDITALGSRAVLALVLAAVAGYLAATGAYRRALTLLAVTLTGSLVGELAKLGFARPRPDLVPHGVGVASLSFPSAHALQASIVYLSLAALVAAHQKGRPARVLVLGFAAVVAVAVGVSRVYLGVHWPSDVVAGWALGTAWASACWLVELGLRAPRTAEPSRHSAARETPSG